MAITPLVDELALHAQAPGARPKMKPAPAKQAMTEISSTAIEDFINDSRSSSPPPLPPHDVLATCTVTLFEASPVEPPVCIPAPEVNSSSPEVGNITELYDSLQLHKQALKCFQLDSADDDKHVLEASAGVQRDVPTSAPDVAASWSFRRDGFMIVPRGRPFMLEIYAGSGRLTRHLRALGADSFAVDYKDGRLRPETAAILMLNLTTEADQAAILRLLSHPQLVYIHFGPPCGTSSRARGIPLSDGRPGPPPLRSEEHPRGLPGLAPRDRVRVETANVLYDFTAQMIAECIRQNVVWSLENPQDSLMWWVDSIRKITQLQCTSWARFQHCAFGGERPKWTGWLHSPPGFFAALARTCPGESQSHVHSKWGQTSNGTFATSLETVYPEDLCQVVAAIVYTKLSLTTMKPAAVIRARGVQQERQQRPERAAAARQPRGGRSRRLLPEFASVLQLKGQFSPHDCRCKPGHKWTATLACGHHVPAGAVTVRTSWPGGAGTDSCRPSSLASASLPARIPTRGCLRHVPYFEQRDVYIGRPSRDKLGRCLSGSRWSNPFRLRDSQGRADCIKKFETYVKSNGRLMASIGELEGKRLLCHCGPNESCHGDVLISLFAEAHADDEQTECSITLGIFHEPAAFAGLSLMLNHPFEHHFSSDVIRAGLAFRMRSTVEDIDARRWSVLRFWENRAKELEDNESELHGQMNIEVAQIMKGKRLLLFKEMLEASGFPTASLLTEHMTCGFPVAGAFPRTLVFPSATREAKLSVEDLWRDRERVRGEVLASCGPSADSEVDRKLLQITRDEVEKGWLKGPLSAEDLEQLGLWIPGRRFSVQQGPKTRPIDDFTCSRVNDTVSAEETIDPSDVDHIAAVMRLHADALSIDEKLRHETSPFYGMERTPRKGEPGLQTRLWDVTSAYKQLAVRPSQGALAISALWNPEKQTVELYRHVALPFGATSAVLAFNWVSTGLVHLLSSLFLLGVTAFYDDFPVTEEQELLESTSRLVDAIFLLLGWEMKKTDGFSLKPEPLGARFDLTAAAHGEIRVGNKPQRAADMQRDIDTFLAAEVVDRKELERLRGRILFARSLCFGRFAGCALQSLNRHLAEQGKMNDTGKRRMTEDLRGALKMLKEAIIDAPTRLVRVTYSQPMIFLSDGAFEEEGLHPAGSIGAVLLIPALKKSLYFACSLTREAMALLTGLAANPIAIIELLAVAMGVILWSHHLTSAAVIGFIDNEASKHALVKSSSAVRGIAAVVDLVCTCEIGDRSLFFWERVASQANLADAPSRGALPASPPGWPAPVRSSAAAAMEPEAAPSRRRSRRVSRATAEPCLHQPLRLESRTDARSLLSWGCRDCEVADQGKDAP